MIACGRLPPIMDRWQAGQPRSIFLNRGFAFQAPAWERCGLVQVLLTRVFRQRDATFVRILNDIRHAHACTPGRRT